MKKTFKTAAFILAALMSASAFTAAPVSAANVSSTPVKVKNTSGGIKVSWKKGSGARRYTVYRKTEGSKAKKKLITTKKLSYTDKKVSSGKSYSYYVRFEGSSASATSASEKLLRLTAPVITKVTADGYGYVDIYYKNFKNATSVVLYRAEVKKGKTGKFKKIDTYDDYYDFEESTTDPGYVTDDTAKEGKTYVYRLAAKKGKYISAQGKKSKKIYYTGGAGYIDAVRDESRTGIMLSFYSNKYAKKYTIYRKADGEKKYAKLVEKKSFPKLKSDEYDVKYGIERMYYIDKKVEEGKSYNYYLEINDGKNKLKGGKSGETMFYIYEDVVKVGESSSRISYLLQVLKAYSSMGLKSDISSDSDCIRIDRDEDGKATGITGLKPGKAEIDFSVSMSELGSAASKKLKYYVLISEDKYYDYAVKPGEYIFKYTADDPVWELYMSMPQLSDYIYSDNPEAVEVTISDKEFSIRGRAFGEANICAKADESSPATSYNGTLKLSVAVTADGKAKLKSEYFVPEDPIPLDILSSLTSAMLFGLYE